MGRKRVLAVVLLLAVFSVCGCAPSKYEPKTGKVADILPEEGRNLYVVATVLSDLSYFNEYRTALKTAEEELHVSTAFVGPEDYNLEELIRIINELIDAGHTYGLILLGWEDALVPSINRAVDSGMYVCTVCQDLPDSRRMMYVGQNNFLVGKTLAELIRKEKPEKAKIVILRSMSLTNVSERIRGMESVLNEYEDYQILADIDTKNDEDIALQKTRSLQGSYPDADVIIAADGISSAALASRMGSFGSDRPLVICFDSDRTVLEAVKNGTVDYTIMANTPLEVYLAISEGERRCLSELQLSADDSAANVRLGPSYIDPGFTILDADNIDYFLK